MAQYGQMFTYNGESSEAHGVIIAGMKTGDVPLGLSRNVTKSSINRFRHRTNTYGIEYADVLTFDIQLMKNPCFYDEQENRMNFTSSDDQRFTRDEIRALAKWLTSPKTPRIFHMYDDTGDEEFDYEGVFTNITPQDNKIFTLTATFECNTPYALSPEQVIWFEESSWVIPNPSDDLEDYVYPVITITPNTNPGGSYPITITNVSDENRSITLKNMRYLDVVVLDCQKMTLKNESGAILNIEDHIDFNTYVYWPRLISGNNTITVDGSAEIEFKFRYPVKVGGY